MKMLVCSLGVCFSRVDQGTVSELAGFVDKPCWLFKMERHRSLCDFSFVFQFDFVAGHGVILLIFVENIAHATTPRAVTKRKSNRARTTKAKK